MSGRMCASAGVVYLLAMTASSVVLAQQPALLDTVTVWAQKLESELHDVPMAVTALSGDDLSDGGLNDIADVAERVPTLDLQRSVSSTTTSLRIRRVGNLGNIPTFEPAVGLFVDGAFRSRSLLGTSDLLDVERIEILRGPQSTLYGKNVSAGVVALYTAAPGESFAARAEATSGWIDAAGSPSLTNLKLALGGPLSSALRASVAASHSQHGHTAKNALQNAPDANNDDRFAIRGQLRWSPSEQLELRLLAGYAQEDDDQGESDVFLAPGAPSSTVAGILRQSGAASACGDNIPHNRRSCSVAVNTLDLEAIDLTLLGEYRLANGWKLASVTGWDRYEALRSEDDTVQLSAPILFYRDSEEGSSVQEELRLTSDNDVASWLAGVFYYRNDYSRGMNGRRPMFGANGAAAYSPIWPTLLGGIPLALPGQLGLHDSHLDTRYFGVFGNVEWKLTHRLALTTGLRWQQEEKDAFINNSVTAPGASLISATLTPTHTASGEPVNGAISRHTDNITWSFTPQYRFSDAVMSYLTIARGAKFGGFNTGFGNAPLSAREFDDERIMHYELGARAALANERARISAAAFHTEYEDYQDAAFLSAQFSVGNAERVDLQGIEFDGALLLGEGFEIDFSASYADLTYETNTTGMCYPGRTPDGSVPRSCNLAGEHPIDAPVWSSHVGVQYERLVSWAELYGRLDWSWTDEYNTSFSADPRLVQNAHSNIAVRIGARFGDAYELVLWADNLLNERVTYLDAVLNLFNDASYQSFMAPPRRYGVTLRVRV